MIIPTITNTGVRYWPHTCRYYYELPISGIAHQDIITIWEKIRKLYVPLAQLDRDEGAMSNTMTISA